MNYRQEYSDNRRHDDTFADYMAREHAHAPETARQALATAREALEGVTEGPWEFDGFQFVSRAEGLNYGTRIIIEACEGTIYSEYSADSAYLGITAETARFITYARQGVPALAAELEAALERERVLREALQGIADAHIPDQPATDIGNELSWAQRHFGELRWMAKLALSGEAQKGEK